MCDKMKIEDDFINPGEDIKMEIVDSTIVDHFTPTQLTTETDDKNTFVKDNEGIYYDAPASAIKSEPTEDISDDILNNDKVSIKEEPLPVVEESILPDNPEQWENSQSKFSDITSTLGPSKFKYEVYDYQKFGTNNNYDNGNNSDQMVSNVSNISLLQTCLTRNIVPSQTFYVKHSSRKIPPTNGNLVMDDSSDPVRPYSYWQLIFQAIRSSKTGQLTCGEIYSHIIENHPYFRTLGKGWTNCVRHVLSSTKYFLRAPKTRGESGKARLGNCWVINPLYRKKLLKKAYKKRNQRVWGQNSYPEDIETSSDDLSDDIYSSMVKSGSEIQKVISEVERNLLLLDDTTEKA